MTLKVLFTTMALIASFATPAVGVKPDEYPYYKLIPNCKHHHNSQEAKQKIIRLMHAPFVKRKAVRHLNRCVMTKAKRRYLTEVVRDGWAWRKAHRYEIIVKRYEALVATIPSWGMSHLKSIAWCESRDNPRAVSSSGAYRGLYQFSFSTWGVVGGSGDPAAASRAEQTWRAWKLLSEHGSGHWPVCG